jgi:hypothetical protein
MNTDLDEVTLSGIVTRTNFGCIVGGDCTVTVDDIVVKIDGGKGKEGTWGSYSVDLYKGPDYYIGKKAKVFGRKYIYKVDPVKNEFTSEFVDNRITLQGSEEYYLTVYE